MPFPIIQNFYAIPTTSSCAVCAVFHDRFYFKTKTFLSIYYVSATNPAWYNKFMKCSISNYRQFDLHIKVTYNILMF